MISFLQLAVSNVLVNCTLSYIIIVYIILYIIKKVIDLQNTLKQISVSLHSDWLMMMNNC